jgi:hypothetical protein
MPVPAQPIKTTDALRRWMRLRAALRTVVACWIVFSAGPLFASCGDYLFRNGKPVSGHSMEKLAEVPKDRNPLKNTAMPCSGPNCSSRPIPHLPVSQIPTAPVRGIRADCILDSQSEQPGAKEMAVIPQSEQGAFFEPLPIFRPPAS